MGNTEQDSDYDEKIFGLELSDKDKLNNHRIAVRYIRSDITVFISSKNLFGFSKETPAKLIDISSKGLLVKCDKKLSIKNHVNVRLLFKDQQSFNIASTVIRKHNGNQYGVKFDHFNNDLGEYILSSQNDLIFK